MLIERNYKHGLTNTRLYRIYHDMIRRCYDPHRKSYPDYGGRGIKICDEWYTPEDPSIGFMKFYNWAINNGYTDKLTINRINPNDDYCPENCEWTDLFNQANQKRNNRWIHDGEEWLTFGQFERKYNKNMYPSKVIHMLNNHHSIDEIINYAKTGETIYCDKYGTPRDNEGWIRLLKKYDQTGADKYHNMNAKYR